MNRNEQIKKLRKEGFTYQELGKIFDISKQRIHQIVVGYKSPYYKSEKYKKYKREYSKKYWNKLKVGKKQKEKT